MASTLTSRDEPPSSAAAVAAAAVVAATNGLSTTILNEVVPPTSTQVPSHAVDITQQDGSNGASHQQIFTTEYQKLSRKDLTELLRKRCRRDRFLKKAQANARASKNQTPLNKKEMADLLDADDARIEKELRVAIQIGSMLTNDARHLGLGLPDVETGQPTAECLHSVPWTTGEEGMTKASQVVVEQREILRLVSDELSPTDDMAQLKRAAYASLMTAQKTEDGSLTKIDVLMALGALRLDLGINPPRSVSIPALFSMDLTCRLAHVLVDPSLEIARGVMTNRNNMGKDWQTMNDPKGELPWGGPQGFMAAFNDSNKVYEHECPDSAELGQIQVKLPPIEPLHEDIVKKNFNSMCALFTSAFKRWKKNCPELDVAKFGDYCRGNKAVWYWFHVYNRVEKLHRPTANVLLRTHGNEGKKRGPYMVQTKSSNKRAAEEVAPRGRGTDNSSSAAAAAAAAVATARAPSVGSGGSGDKPRLWTRKELKQLIIETFTELVSGGRTAPSDAAAAAAAAAASAAAASPVTGLQGAGGPTTALQAAHAAAALATNGAEVGLVEEAILGAEEARTDDKSSNGDSNPDGKRLKVSKDHDVQAFL